MVAAHHDRSLDFSLSYKFVDGQTKLGPFPVAKPADAGGKALELDALAGQINPAAQNAILRKHLQNQIVSYGNVGGLAGERHPAEGAAPFAKQGPYVSRHKSREIIGVFDAPLKSKRPDIVSVIKSHAAHLLKA